METYFTIVHVCLLSILPSVLANFYVPNLPDPTIWTIQAGDINLGLLRDIHDTKDTDECTGTISAFGAQTALTMSYALARINANATLLPNVILGMRVYDECGTVAGTVIRSLQMLSSNYDDTGKLKPLRERIIGIVGSSDSPSAVKMAQLTPFYKTPQIGIVTTSDILSDKTKYPYFVRFNPPDKLQTRAMIDIVKYMNWKYVTIVYNQDSYGLNGQAILKALLDATDICIADSIPLEPTDSADQGIEMANRIMLNPNSRAILVFGGGTLRINAAVDALYNKLDNGGFVFIFSDAFRPSATGMKPSFVNSFFISMSVTLIPGIKQYLDQQTYDTLKVFPWRDELMTLLNCTQLKCKTTLMFSGTAILQSFYYEPVFAFAQALHALIRNYCPAAFQDKTLLDACVTGELLLRELYNVSFDGAIGRMELDENGDGSGSYDLVQLQMNSTVIPAAVATWSKHDGLVLSSPFKWGGNFTGNSTAPLSVCSRPCPPGQFRHNVTTCCWVCKPCRDGEYVGDLGYSCLRCPLTFWPKPGTFDTCEPISPQYSNIQLPTSLVITCVSLTGIVSCVLTSGVYYVRRADRLVKACSIGMSNIILIGLVVSFITAILIAVEPSYVVCYVQRLAYSIGTTVVYAPLMVKSDRVYRIFTSGKKGKTRPPFISSQAQIIITAILIVGQAIISAAMAVTRPPVVELSQMDVNVQYVEKFCSLPPEALIVPLSYNIVIILMAAFYGYMTRKLPENFNESKCIFMSVCSTLFLWVAFLPTYYTTLSALNQGLLLSLSLIISCFVVFITLFVTRLYAIFYVDEDNLKIAMGTISTSKAETSTMNNASLRQRTMNGDRGTE